MNLELFKAEAERHQKATMDILQKVADGEMEVYEADYKIFMAYHRHEGATANIGKGLDAFGNELEG